MRFAPKEHWRSKWGIGGSTLVGSEVRQVQSSADWVPDCVFERLVVVASENHKFGQFSQMGEQIWIRFNDEDQKAREDNQNEEWAQDWGPDDRIEFGQRSVRKSWRSESRVFTLRTRVLVNNITDLFECFVGIGSVWGHMRRWRANFRRLERQCVLLFAGGSQVRPQVKLCRQTRCHREIPILFIERVQWWRQRYVSVGLSFWWFVSSNVFVVLIAGLRQRWVIQIWNHWLVNGIDQRLDNLWSQRTFVVVIGGAIGRLVMGQRRSVGAAQSPDGGRRRSNWVSSVHICRHSVHSLHVCNYLSFCSTAIQQKQRSVNYWSKACDRTDRHHKRNTERIREMIP